MNREGVADGFETERDELVQKIDALAVDQSELHRLEWETKQRTGEIWELQKARSALKFRQCVPP